MEVGIRAALVFAAVAFVAAPVGGAAAATPLAIRSGHLVIAASSPTSTVTDLNGFYGIVGRQLQIDHFDMLVDTASPSSNVGSIDLVSSTLSFRFAMTLNYDVRDAASGALLGSDSVSGEFLEAGQFSVANGYLTGRLDGAALAGAANQNTGPMILAYATPGWLKELLSGTTLIGLDQSDLTSGALTELHYMGGFGGLDEMRLLVSPEFGGGEISGTARGALVVQAVPEPSVWVMMILGFFAAGLGIRRGRCKVLASTLHA